MRDALSRAGLRFEHAETRAPGEAVRLAADAAERGAPLVVAVGGDGTFNEVVNGLTDDDGCARAAAGAVMTGRGRDACRNLGLPRDLLAAARRVAEAPERRFDLGLVRWPGGRRLFVNAAGAGFDAEVAALAARGGGGTLAYLRAVMQGLRAYRPVPMTVELAGEALRISGPRATVVVANGRYFGGGMKIAPPADPADGRLFLVLLGALGRVELLRWLSTLYWGGHFRNAKVSGRAATRLSIVSDTRVPIQIDGDACAWTPAEVSVCPGALRLRGS